MEHQATRHVGRFPVITVVCHVVKSALHRCDCVVIRPTRVNVFVLVIRKMTTHVVRHTSLVKIGEFDLSDDTNPLSDILDFKEMTSGTIQIVVEGADMNDGSFKLYQSILCAESSFAEYPGGVLAMDSGCPNLAANISHIPFRYMRVQYNRGSDTTGTATIYARAKL